MAKEIKTYKKQIIISSIVIGAIALIWLNQKRKTKKAIDFYKELELTYDVNVATSETGVFDGTILDGKKLGDLLTDEKAKELAKDIRDAYSFWGITENQVYASLNACKSKVQIAQVSQAYNESYKRDLRTDLSSMWENHAEKAFNIINNKPNII